ncbi:hypothetical protein PM10SUCC1_29540 [Propionigenium maris DSM 9537]|uniref:Uncharacterized protein n=1 Tax=Propionigenium maris DSM 9537 TaxID=1123000 RepID=A0A9W6LPV8_9FUSO|nr:hypothetical protein [Propionigenium maris]GLI57440.1 hypothetical protein PM10SUCC1_29540 [Propionigenium maris DSM 9537]
MKKTLLILMFVVLSSLSFAARGDKGSGEDFYSLYNSAYKAVETPGMHKNVGLKEGHGKMVKDIINKGWYDIKMLEVEKLKHVFAIDKLLVDGPGNKEKIDEHIAEIRKIKEKMDKVYEDTKKECEKHMDFSKMK